VSGFFFLSNTFYLIPHLSQKAEIKKNKVKKNRVGTELEKKAAEASSVDGQQSLSNATGSSVCAKNISRTPNGKKVVLWTRLELLCNIHVCNYTILSFLFLIYFQKYFCCYQGCVPFRTELGRPFKTLI